MPADVDPGPVQPVLLPGRQDALVMAERLHEIEVRDAHTTRLLHTTPAPCSGFNHADFTTDLTTMVASFSSSTGTCW